MDNLRCINCGIATNRQWRHLLNATEIQSVIRQWITPRSVTESDHVCHSCWILARQSLTEPGRSHTASPNVGHRHVCINCGRSLLRARFHTMSNNTERDRHIFDVISEWLHPQQVQPTSSICHPCWQRACRAQPPVHLIVPSNNEEDANIADRPLPPSPSNEVEDPEDVVRLPEYSRTSDTQRYCFVMGCLNNERLSLPLALRQMLLKEYKYYVPCNNRVCSSHLIENEWSFLNAIEHIHNNLFTVSYIQNMLTLLNAVPEPLVNFNNVDTMPDHLVHYWLGRTKEELHRILAVVPRLAQIPSDVLALSAYLIKIRTGDSYDRISTLMQKSKRSIINMISQTRELLEQYFVPVHLGLNHLSREQVVQRNLLIPKGLFCIQESAIAIMDGTYVYVQKSSNYSYQKNTYSLHKYRNLVKMFLIVSTDGYIIEVLGPYPATTSDADIAKNEFRENQALRRFFHENDAFILDRGFRDALPLMRRNGYRTYVPASVQVGEIQLNTLDANQSRAVTICRWVVEVVNGRFKRDFKIFRHEYYNSASKNIIKDFSVAAALINAFHPLIRDREDAGEILQIINNKMYTENTLADIVISTNLNRRRSNFVRINVDNNNLNDFPQLTYSQLILLCLGTYQIKQARSYYGEHIRANGSYIIEVCREVNSSLLGELSNPNSWLLRGKIQSRHVSRKIYFVYILIDSSLQGRNAITQHYCNCLVGRRTVGCCAHIMSIVWFLGWARFQRHIIPPAPHLDDILIIYDNENAVT